MIAYKEKVTPSKTYMFVRQAYEKICELFFSIPNATLSKMDTYF